MHASVLVFLPNALKSLVTSYLPCFQHEAYLESGPFKIEAANIFINFRPYIPLPAGKNKCEVMQLKNLLICSCIETMGKSDGCVISGITY